MGLGLDCLGLAASGGSGKRCLGALEFPGLGSFLPGPQVAFTLLGRHRDSTHRMSEGDSVGGSVHGKPSVVYRFFTRLGQVYQSWLDKSTPYTAVRWVVTLGLSFIYMIRVYLLQVGVAPGCGFTAKTVSTLLSRPLLTPGAHLGTASESGRLRRPRDPPRHPARGRRSSLAPAALCPDHSRVQRGGPLLDGRLRQVPAAVLLLGGVGVCERPLAVPGWSLAEAAFLGTFVNDSAALDHGVLAPSAHGQPGGRPDDGPSLPTRQNEEFRPFIRRLPEFKFWHAATKGILVAMVCTFFEAFNVPVFWPILVMYFIMLFCITMKRQIKHMIKYRYIPFTHGKRTYRGKEDVGKAFAS
ncbi:Protein RER1 [Galemys pyrenaicus]|uniref:Protein RER1 n=1 Tax=Galemys pyrenaicus TaxID=202257 RepID=A0A8J5ZDM9_GALPY|nr:Protein RER1 [Galemys pyrenaicus]